MDENDSLAISTIAESGCRNDIAGRLLEKAPRPREMALFVPQFPKVPQFPETASAYSRRGTSVQPELAPITGASRVPAFPPKTQVIERNGRHARIRTEDLFCIKGGFKLDAWRANVLVP
jgi:hypothetical protein